MNIKTKIIIASVFLTALFTGQTAIAGDNDRFPESTFATTTDSVVIAKVSYQAPSVFIKETFTSGKK